MSDYNKSRYYRDPDRWQLARGSITFDGTAGKGAQGTVTLFDVTGQVQLGPALPVYCATDLVGAATMTYGWTGVAAGLSGGWGTFGNATTFDVGDWWGSLSGTDADAGGSTIVSGDAGVTISADIILTIGAANITAGVLNFFVWWRALSADGNVALGPNMVAI